MTCPSEAQTKDVAGACEKAPAGDLSRREAENMTAANLSWCDAEDRLTVSFVIPAWNHYDLLLQCLHSIDRVSGGGVEVVVVDNGSDAGERALLLDGAVWSGRVVPELSREKSFVDKRIRFIPLSVNTGFSHAVNVGIRAASGDLIILLNNDILLEPDFIPAVRRAMAEHPDWLHAATKIRQFHHPERLDDAGNFVLPTGRAVKLGYAEVDQGQYGRDLSVFSACGAAAVYRRAFFEQVGFFDEDFFAYLEDVDLGFRAQRMGLPCGWIPEAVTLHIGSATTGSMKNTFTVRLLARNQVGMLVKNLPGALWLLLGIPIGATMAAQWLRFGMMRNGNGRAYLSGFLESMKRIGIMRKKRKAAKAGWKQPTYVLLGQLAEAGRLYRRSKANRVGG